MSTRFVTNLLLTVAAGFILVATQAFAPATAGWLAFAVTGLGAVAIAVAGLVLPRRGVAQRVLDGAVLTIGLWTVVESLTFTGAALTWLSFGAAAGIAALAITGLTLHEVRSERVVHSLEVREAQRHETGAAA